MTSDPDMPTPDDHAGPPPAEQSTADPSVSGHDGDADKGWAEKPGFIRMFLVGLYVACALAALAGFVPGWHNPHPHFAVEKFPVFFALWGFGSFMFIVLAGQHLRNS